jgi:hypothetical protein
MEKWYEDMGEFSWSELGDDYCFDESEEGIVVEDVDGENRWVFVKI